MARVLVQQKIAKALRKSIEGEDPGDGTLPAGHMVCHMALKIEALLTSSPI